jgi:hypothetical protein
MIIFEEAAFSIQRSTFAGSLGGRIQLTLSAEG